MDYQDKVVQFYKLLASGPNQVTKIVAGSRCPLSILMARTVLELLDIASDENGHSALSCHSHPIQHGQQCTY
jgi:hypothetical protein